MGDAAVQGLAIAAKWQENFSLAEMLEVGVTAALPLKTAYISKLLELATAQAVTQFMEMCTGLRPKFDLNSILIQVSAAALELKLEPAVDGALGDLDISNGIIRNVILSGVNTTASAISGRLLNQSPLENQELVANMLGGVLGDSINSLLKKGINYVSVDNGRISAETDAFIKKMRSGSEFNLPDPKLDIVKSSIEIKNELSELNRTRMQRWSGSLIKTTPANKSPALTSKPLNSASFWGELRADIANPQITPSTNNLPSYLYQSVLQASASINRDLQIDLLHKNYSSAALDVGTPFVQAAAIAAAGAFILDAVGSVVASGLGLGELGLFGKTAISTPSIMKGAEKFIERASIGKASEVNAIFEKQGMKAPYNDSVSPRTITLNNQRTFVRVHTEINQARSWLMRSDEIEGLTPLEIKNKFALPDMPKYVSEVHVPAGTSLRVGRVAAQDGWGAGGGMQYELLQRLPESSFKNMMPFQNRFELLPTEEIYPGWSSMVRR